jgi:hypothetical protein
VVDGGSWQVPIEVKYRRLETPEITRALRSFIERYQPSKALIINVSLDTTLVVQGTTIHLVPFYKILLDDALWGYE